MNNFLTTTSQSSHAIRRVVLCPQHLHENRHIFDQSVGRINDPCFICDAEWYAKFIATREKQMWLEEIIEGDVVYLSGPMSGFKDYNKPAFHLMEHVLAQKTKQVISPARSWQIDDNRFTYAQFMRRDICLLVGCNKVVMLRGYDKSKGAQLELKVAESIGCVIYYERY